MHAPRGLRRVASLLLLLLLQSALFNDPFLSDFKLKLVTKEGGPVLEEYHVHGIVLAGQSPYFKTRLQNWIDAVGGQRGGVWNPPCPSAVVCLWGGGGAAVHSWVGAVECAAARWLCSNVRGRGGWGGRQLCSSWSDWGVTHPPSPPGQQAVRQGRVCPSRGPGMRQPACVLPWPGAMRGSCGAAATAARRGPPGGLLAPQDQHVVELVIAEDEKEAAELMLRCAYSGGTAAEYANAQRLLACMIIADR